MAKRLLRAFGPERFRIELQRPFWRNDSRRNRLLAELAERLGVPSVATGNVHAHARARIAAAGRDGRGAPRRDARRDASRGGGGTPRTCSPRRRGWRSASATFPGAVEEGERLAERLRFDLTEDLGYRYPGSEDPDADRRLAELCAAVFDERYPSGARRREEARARLEEELRVIRGLGLSGFFILHRDLLELAREVAVEVRGSDSTRRLLPPGRGRGSSVSSIVCYLTGLSHVDPIENELLLGRFLNEELTALPDIDLDFPRDIREVLIPRVHERYGRDKSALVAAFSTYPGALCDARLRQGARPPARGDRAAGARGGPLEGPRRDRRGDPRARPRAGAARRAGTPS